MTVSIPVDLAKIVANSTGTGAITLGAAASGFRGIEALQNGQVYSYTIQQGDEYETGRGTYLSATQQFTRSPIWSSNGNAPIDLQTNALVAFVVLAEDLDSVSLTAQAIQAAEDAVTAQQQTDADATQTAADRAAVEAAVSTVSSNIPYSPAYAATLPRGLTGITIGGTAITGATPGSYSLTPVGGSITGIVANLVVDSATTAHAVIVKPGLGAGTTPPTFANPAGATLPSGTTLTAAVGPLVSDQQSYWVASADGQSVFLYANNGGAVVTSPIGGTQLVQGAAVVQPIIDTFKKYTNSQFADLTKGGLYANLSTAAPYPLMVDQAGQVLLAIDPVTGRFTARFDGNDSGFRNAALAAIAPNTGAIETTSQSAIAFPFYDAAGSLLFGLDVAKQRPLGLMGPLMSSSSPIALALADQPMKTDWTVLMFYGQSLACGADSGPLISTTQFFNDISFAGGPRSGAEQGGSTASTAPLIEQAGAPSGQVDGETPVSGAAYRASRDALLKSAIDPANLVIFGASAGSSGKAIAQLAKGTAPYTTLLNQINAAKALAVAAGKSFSIPAICWVQGEQDVGIGVYASYRAALKQLRLDTEADIQAITGQTEPVAFLCYQTALDTQWLSWGPSQTSDFEGVQRAQLDLCNTEPHFYLVTPCWWFPPAPPPGLSNVHLSSLGYNWMGQYFGRAWAEIVVQKIKPRSLRPLGAVAVNNQVRVKFDVPYRPMVIDVTNIAVYPNYGFEVQDDTGVMALPNSAFTISESGDELVITLSRALGTNPFVRGAMKDLKQGEVKTKTCGANLRDSCPETALIAGTEYPLWYMCPHFSFPIHTIA